MPSKPAPAKAQTRCSCDLAVEARQWASADPLFLQDPTASVKSPLESGLYAYALNRPSVLSDPTGLTPPSATNMEVGSASSSGAVDGGGTIAPPTQITIGETGGSAADRKNLSAAVSWLAQRYPEVIPTSARTVGIGETEEAKGSTSVLTGNVTLKSGLSLDQMVGTLAHEFLHSRASLGGRMMQNVNEKLRGSEEHNFLHNFGNAVKAHFKAEQKAGRPVSRGEAFMSRLLTDRPGELFRSSYSTEGHRKVHSRCCVSLWAVTPAKAGAQLVGAMTHALDLCVRRDGLGESRTATLRPPWYATSAGQSAIWLPFWAPL